MDKPTGLHTGELVTLPTAGRAGATWREKRIEYPGMERICYGLEHGQPVLRLRAPRHENQPHIGLVFSFGGEMQDDKQRRGESVMLTFRFPKRLYERLPVEPAPNAGVPAGRSGYLRRLLVEAVERDLAAEVNEQAV